MQAALENRLHLSDMFAAIWAHEIVDIPQRCIAISDSGGRVLSNERGESFPLRHDAPRLRYNETSGHRGCHSRSDVPALRSRCQIFGSANGGATSGIALGSISL